MRMCPQCLHDEITHVPIECNVVIRFHSKECIYYVTSILACAYFSILSRVKTT